MATIEELKKMRATVRKIEDTASYYLGLFKADGHIDKAEQKNLDKIAAALIEVKKLISKKEEKLGFGESIINVYNASAESIEDKLSSTDDEIDKSLIKAPKDLDKGRDTTPVVENPTSPTATISTSVGKKGKNKPSDVLVIQKLLNSAGYSPKLKEDSDYGTKTEKAIFAYQKQALNFKHPDGLISVGGLTWKGLIGGKKISNSETPVTAANNTPPAHIETTPDATAQPTGSVIKKSVGKGGVNDTNDVLIIQKLLRDTWDYKIPQTGLVKDKTIQAIAKFQHRFAGIIKKQDAKVDAGGTTWKYLIGTLKPTLEKQDDGTLAGAETETEKKLAEFVKNMSDIQVEVSPGEFIGVRPPYHMNSPKRKAAIDKARAANKAVNKIIGSFEIQNRIGKATPDAIKGFLEKCIAKGLIKDKSSTGLNQFLDKYGFTTDCSGLAIQTVNFLEEGNMTRERNDTETVQITTASGIKKKGKKITAPKDLKAGDMMVNNKHVRVITDVDITGNEVAFTTLESGSNKELGYGDGVGDSGDGVGEVRWKFADGTKFENCQQLKGNKWGAGGAGYVYRRMEVKKK